MTYPSGFAHSQLHPAAVRLLLPSGSLVAMRYEMRTPFVAWLVQQAAAAAAPTTPLSGEGQGGIPLCCGTLDINDLALDMALDCIQLV